MHILRHKVTVRFSKDAVFASTNQGHSCIKLLAILLYALPYFSLTICVKHLNGVLKTVRFLGCTCN